MVMIPLFGCSARGKSHITYLHYSHSNTMVAGDVKEWTVKQEDRKIAVVTIRKGFEETSYRISSTILEEIGRIADQYKMHRFKGQYVRKNVLDGWSWDFAMEYEDGKSVEGSGYMKYPSGAGEAFKELTAFIDQWCAVPDSARMKVFEYSRSNGMVIGHGESYYVNKESDGFIHVVFNEGKSNELAVVTDYSKIFDDLQKLVMDNGIYKFKGSYMPDTEIRDGDSWSLNVFYEDSDFDIRAHGYMAWPEGFDKAISSIHAYFNAWRALAAQDKNVSKEAAAILLDEVVGGRKSVSFDRETGNYSITTYDIDGNAATTINYSSKGMVLNGEDRNDPMKEY